MSAAGKASVVVIILVEAVEVVRHGVVERPLPLGGLLVVLARVPPRQLGQDRAVVRLYPEQGIVLVDLEVLRVVPRDVAGDADVEP